MKTVKSTIRGRELNMDVIEFADIKDHLAEGVTETQAVDFIVDFFAKWQLKRPMASAVVRKASDAYVEEQGLDWESIKKNDQWKSKEGNFSIEKFYAGIPEEYFSDSTLQGFADEVSFPKITCGVRKAAAPKKVVLSERHKSVIADLIARDTPRDLLVTMLTTFNVSVEDAEAYLTEEMGDKSKDGNAPLEEI